MAALMKHLTLSLLLLAATTRTAFPPASTQCTEESSRGVSWDIHDLEVDTNTKFDFGPGTAGRVSFSITNTANNYSFHCLQGDGATGRSPNRYLLDGKVWYSCNVYCKGARDQPDEDDPPLDTSFHFDMKTKAFSISQTWLCGGWNKSTVTSYTGTGTSVIANQTCSPLVGGRPDQVTCLPADVIVKASNVSVTTPKNSTEDAGDGDPYMDGGGPPVNPFVPQVPPRPGILPSTPGCSNMSRSPSFGVSAFVWSTSGISFTLDNTALNYTQSCSIVEISQSVEERLQQQTWWNCTRFDPMHVDYPANGVYTSILYGGPTNILGMNQTWYCDDEDPSNPTVYSVYGEANFPIKCNETRYCMAPSEYDDKPELVVNDFCNADDLTILPSHTDTFRVSKDQAIQQFKPHGYNCSSKSLEPTGTQFWEITRFTLKRNYVPPDPTANLTADYTDEIEFYYNNTATDNDWPRNTGWRPCLYYSDENDKELDGVKQLVCAMSFEPFGLSFQFDNMTSTLTLTQAWTCDGLDSDHTNHFAAVGSAHLDLRCQKDGNDTTCTFTDRLTVPMARIAATLNVDGEAAAN